MYDPYAALGLTRNATDEEIKKAYRSLSRKYHPDANINNPNKEQAEEKFKEIQQAYQQIMYEKERGTSGGYGTSGYGQPGTGGTYWDFGDFFGGFGYEQPKRSRGQDAESVHRQAAENYIRNAHYREALNVLNGMNNRDAHWYYLNAIANSGLGNNVAAMESAQHAVSMEPGNQQYQQLYARLQNGGSWYYDRRQSYGSPVGSSGSFCLKLCLANMMLNLCCGGMCCGGNGLYCGGGPYI